MKFILNVGLKSSDYSSTIPTTIARIAILAAGFRILESSTRKGPLEDVLIAMVESDTGFASAERVAYALDQDCVAIWSMASGKGYLEGPGADKWGDFNPDFFRMLDGSTLSQSAAEEVAA